MRKFALALLLFAGCDGNVNENTDLAVVTIRVSKTSSVSEINLGAGFQNQDFNWFRDQGTVNPIGQTCSISDDGRLIAYTSNATNITPNDGNGFPDVFYADVNARTVRMVSNANNGALSDNVNGQPVISGNGRYVVWTSQAGNILGAGEDTNGLNDVYRWDSQTNQSIRISSTAGGVAAGGAQPSVTIDGNEIAFQSSSALLDAADADASPDIFVWKWNGGAPTVALVSRQTGGAKPAQNCFHPCVSPEGRYIAFQSDQVLDLAVNNVGTEAIFLRDLQALPGPTTTCISHNATMVAPNGMCEAPSVSANADFVVYHSKATNLAGADDNSATVDIYLYDRQADATSRISIGNAGFQTNSDSADAHISANGRYVTYSSVAKNLTPPDLNNKQDIFFLDRVTHLTQRLSVRTFGDEAEDDSLGPAISADGKWVVFGSKASNLVDDDLNGVTDVFIRGPLH